MKKLVDLLNERTDKIGQMEAILEKARTEKRVRTADEGTAWDALNTEVGDLSGEIDTLQRQEELNRIAADQKPPDPAEEDVAKRYDLSKAIGQTRRGAMDGVELEMHQEAEGELKGVAGVVGNLLIPRMLVERMYKRANEETKTTGLAAGHIPLEVGTPSIIVPNPLFREIGATVYEGLTGGKLDLPFSQGHTANSVAEEGTAVQSTPTDTKGTLTAGRFQGWQTYTQEYLAESVVMPTMFADMLAAIDRGIGRALLLDAIAANVMTGFATSDIKAALDWGGVLDIINELESDNFVNEAYLMSKPVFYKLAQTEKAATTAEFIVKGGTGRNKGMIFGIDAWGSSFLPVHDTDKYDILYGDLKETFVGMWGGAQLLIDPFTQSDDGYVKITFSRIAAVETNPYAVASKRNVDAA